MTAFDGKKPLHWLAIAGLAVAVYLLSVLASHGLVALADVTWEWIGMLTVPFMLAILIAGLALAVGVFGFLGSAIYQVVRRLSRTA